jgi:hypothetical protein
MSGQLGRGLIFAWILVHLGCKEGCMKFYSLTLAGMLKAGVIAAV